MLSLSCGCVLDADADELKVSDGDRLPIELEGDAEREVEERSALALGDAIEVRKLRECFELELVSSADRMELWCELADLGEE